MTEDHQKKDTAQKKTEKEDLLPDISTGSFKEKFFLAGAFFLPVFLLAFLRMICWEIHGGEPGTDNFYHAAISLAGPEVFASKKFPFLALSVWHDTFADKEFFYHILLWLLFHIQKLFTDNTFPFTFPAMFFISTTILGLIVLLKELKIPSKLIFISALLFCGSSFAFTYRLLMLRPHVFSIALIFICCFILAKQSEKKSSKSCGIWLFLLSFLYTWSYSNPHFILFPVILYALFAGKEYGRKIFLLPLFSLAGIFAGYLIHPQMPHTFHIWKIQSIDALIKPVFYAGSHLSPKLIPMEMLPGNFSWYRNMLPFYFLCYGGLFLFMRLKGKKNFYTPVEKTILLLAVLFTLGTFCVLRAVEYAVPFAVSALAILLKYAVQERTIFFESAVRGRKTVHLLIFAAAALALLNTNLLLKSNFGNRIPEGPAKFLKGNTVKGSLVVNLDWGDFPAMFYANRHNTLLWGMDPAFSYAFAPEKARKLENCVINSIRFKDVDSRIHELTGAEYAFVLSRRKRFVRYLKECGWIVVYESEEGTIFSLKKNSLPAAEHKIIHQKHKEKER